MRSEETISIANREWDNIRESLIEIADVGELDLSAIPSTGVVPPDTSVPSKQWELTPGLNYYMSHDHRWKLQLNYTFQRNEATLDAPDVDANIVRAQLQANF